MFTEYGLGKLRTYLMGQVSYAMYRVGTQYYRASIGSAEVMSDGRVAVTLTLNPATGGTVTEVQLYDSSGGLLASKQESMALTAADGGILYRFRFAIREEE